MKKNKHITELKLDVENLCLLIVFSDDSKKGYGGKHVFEMMLKYLIQAIQTHTLNTLNDK